MGATRVKWNPFRRQGRPDADETEQRTLDVNSVHFPVASDGIPEAMSVERALRLAPVFAAGRILASNIAALPIQQYRRSGERREKIPTSRLYTQPTAQGTRHDWVFRAITSMVYRGNAVGIVTSRDNMEYPVTVEWLHPDFVYVEDTLLGLGEPGSYTNPIWSYNGVRLPSEDIVHIPWFTLPARVWGLSPLRAYAQTVNIGLAAEKFSNDWFKAGGVPPGTFANENQVVPQAEAVQIKQRLVRSIQSHEPIVYGKDWTYTPITVSPNEAQFVETMRLGATQIAAIYGIPPELIGGETGGSMSYSSPEQRQIELVQFALLPWMAKLEDAFSALLPRGQYVKFNADALIRTDAKTRYENYEKARLIGLNNIDEMRALEDQPPLPDGQGQDYTALPLLAGKTIGTPAIRADEDATESRNGPQETH